jgi:hypothetical protein
MEAKMIAVYVFGGFVVLIAGVCAIAPLLHSSPNKK